MTIATDLSEVASEVCKLHERVLTDKQIEIRTWEILAYCHVALGSMNSKKHSGIIRDAIVGAVTDVQKRIEELGKELGAAKSKAKERGNDVLEQKRIVACRKRDIADLKVKLKGSHEKRRKLTESNNQYRRINDELQGG
jgi:hypothetical protein